MASNAQTATQSDALSNVLGGIGQTQTQTDSGSGSVTATGSNSAAPTDSTNVSNGNSRPAASNTNSDSTGSGALSGPALSTATLSGAPQLTSGLNIPHLTGLPTLSGFYSYPPPTVPPVSNAPYLQATNLPENFVFIIVGAVIAFVALVIVIWRVMTSWSMNRRFRRSDGVAGTATKGTYTPLHDLKKANPSTHDMKDLGNLPKNFQSVPSLFFSPTAEVARNSRVTSTKDSRHLPAGHYRDSSTN